MDKIKLTDLYQLLALLCVVGMGIIGANQHSEDYSVAMFYLGLGITLAGASLKILTKRGALILVAGVLGTIFFKSDTPVCISAGLLACWYLFDLQTSSLK